MNKIWYIKLDEIKEGPYNVQDLKRHPRMTPDTPVWKEGFKDWILARYVPELQVLFEDDQEKQVELKDRFKLKTIPTEDATLVLEGSSFPYFFFWLMVLLIVLFYFFYELRGL